MAADKPDITTVIFGSYEIKTWYSSPYPIEEELRNEALAAEREAHQARMQQLDMRPSKRSRHNTIEPSAAGQAAALDGQTAAAGKASNVPDALSRGVAMPADTSHEAARSLEATVQNTASSIHEVAAQAAGMPSDVATEAEVEGSSAKEDSTAIDEHSLVVTQSDNPLRLNGGSSTSHSHTGLSPTNGVRLNSQDASAANTTNHMMPKIEAPDFSSSDTDEEPPPNVIPIASKLKPPPVMSRSSSRQRSTAATTSTPDVAGDFATNSQPMGISGVSSKPMSKRGRSRNPVANIAAADAGDTSETSRLESDSSTVKSTRGKAVKLYVCEGCFKYFVQAPVYAEHLRVCTTKRPPGRKVYQRGAHTIWEVDGEKSKLFCQNLALFGKLFINHKYVFFETTGFLFYVLTEARPSFDHCLGFFSKEKISYNDYNLACIVTFPPYQKRGFGTLLMEFSYELSSRASASRAGTPERPLSELGLRGYLQFWTSVLVRYFRLIFFARNDPRLVAPISDRVMAADVTGKRAEDSKKKHWKGYEGEVEPAKAPAMAHIPPPAQDSEDTWSMKFSLAEIANATHLREDDVAFALIHSGLANLRSNNEVSPSEEAEALADLEVVIGPAVVEAVAERFKVKLPVMSRAHCHI